MKLVIQSDFYAQVKPKRIHELRNLVESPDRLSFYNFSGSTSKGEPRFYQDLNQMVFRAVDLIRFTNQEVYSLLTKSIGIVENTTEYTEYLLNETFGNAKFMISPPGTLRFYSQELICFYNAKTWRKITL